MWLFIFIKNTDKNSCENTIKYKVIVSIVRLSPPNANKNSVTLSQHHQFLETCVISHSVSPGRGDSDLY
jgi:hypothetical protein